jgi:alpha-glucosidase
LRGTPFIYQGDELGLTDAEISDEQRVDPGGRDGCRAPIPWDGSPDHGWPTGAGVRTWLPMAPEADGRNRMAESAEPGSILHLYRRVIALRHAMPALSRGSFEMMDLPDGVLGYRRTLAGSAVEVLVNFTGAPVAVDPAGPVGAEILLASDNLRPSGLFDGRLGPDQAIVVRS